MSNRRRANRRSHRRQRWAVAFLVILVAAVFGAGTARLFIWPDLEPIPRHVDAIIELGGASSDRRDRRALELAWEHRADFLVQSTTHIRSGDAHLPPGGSWSDEPLLPRRSEHDTGRGSVHRRAGRPTRLEVGHPGDHTGSGVASPAADDALLLGRRLRGHRTAATPRLDTAGPLPVGRYGEGGRCRAILLAVRAHPQSSGVMRSICSR